MLGIIAEPLMSLFTNSFHYVIFSNYCNKEIAPVDIARHVLPSKSIRTIVARRRPLRPASA
jgi:hypothetical protein